MSGSRILPGVLAAVAVLLATASASAQPECYGDPTCAEVFTAEELQAAAQDEGIEEIVLMNDIQLDDEDLPSIWIEGSAGGVTRYLSIRSALDGPHALEKSISAGNGVLQCWPSNRVHLELRNLELDGRGNTTMAVDTSESCSLRLEEVYVHDFSMGEGGILHSSGTNLLEVARCRFEHIDGSAIAAFGGQVSITQSVFSDCHRGSGAGALLLGGVAQGDLRGNVFWGCYAQDGDGGAIRGESGTVLWSWGDVFVGNEAANGGAIAWHGAGGLNVFNDLFVGNVTTSSPTAHALEIEGMAPPGCNHQLFDLDGVDGPDDIDPPPVDPADGDAGMGGAILMSASSYGEVVKTVFVANRAGIGGAIAHFDEGDGPQELDETFDVPPVSLQLAHCTLVDNHADEGAGMHVEADFPVHVDLFGNLWLDHDGPALVSGGEVGRVNVAADHTDGASLADGLEGSPCALMGTGCGAEPLMTRCPVGCESDVEVTFCGESPVQNNNWSESMRPVLLNVAGYELCPTDAPCEPSAGEPCDPIDADCVWGAGVAADPFTMPDGSPPNLGHTGMPCAWLGFTDQDMDGTPDAAECGEEAAADPTQHPYADETCNGIDDNCDGQIDEGLLEDWYEDGDGDGFGGGEPILSCVDVDGRTRDGTDCDDQAADAYPGAEEIFGDEGDNDCDGVTDLDAPGCHSAGCLATRVAPGDSGLQLSGLPLLPILLGLGGWRALRTRGRR
jgi:hypothetical protein